MTTPTSSLPPQLPLRLESRLLRDSGFVHGFFTRRGGVSPPPFDSLNFGTTGLEAPTHFEANLRVVAGVLGLPVTRVYMPTQVHGVDAVVISGTEDRDEVRKCEADTVLSHTPGLACAIRTADCVPVLIGCLESGAALACHAGWKGCVRGAIPAAVQALRAAGGTKLVAAIGPHISVHAFEVSDEVAQQLLAASADQTIVDRTRAKPHVDLRRLARAQLAQCGLEHTAIDDVLGCTVLMPELFFSFRRDAAESGRQLSAIVPRGR